jgi:hypothetical protein
VEEDRDDIDDVFDDFDVELADFHAGAPLFLPRALHSLPQDLLTGGLGVRHVGAVQGLFYPVIPIQQYMRSARPY